MAKKYHPDTNKDDPQAKEKFAQLAEAYEVWFQSLALLYIEIYETYSPSFSIVTLFVVPRSSVMK